MSNNSYAAQRDKLTSFKENLEILKKNLKGHDEEYQRLLSKAKEENFFDDYLEILNGDIAVNYGKIIDDIIINIFNFQLKIDGFIKEVEEAEENARKKG